MINEDSKFYIQVHAKYVLSGGEGLLSDFGKESGEIIKYSCFANLKNPIMIAINPLTGNCRITFNQDSNDEEIEINCPADEIKTCLIWEGANGV